VAVVAPGTVLSLFQEDWLDARSIRFKIKGSGLLIT